MTIPIFYLNNPDKQRSKKSNSIHLNYDEKSQDDRR